MKPERIVKKQAREILRKDNLPAAVGVTAVLGIVLMTCVYLSELILEIAAYVMGLLGVNFLYESALLYYSLTALLTAGGIILSLPIFLGAVRFFFLMAKSENGTFSELFHYLKRGRYLSAVGKSLRIIAGHLWQGIVSFLPGILIFITAVAASAEKDHLDFYNILWYAISYAMLFAGLIFFCFLTASRFLSLYLLIDSEELKASDALRHSQSAMTKFEKSVPRIMLLHLPALLLCILIIPMLFIVPYIMTSYAVSAKWILKISNNHNEDE